MLALIGNLGPIETAVVVMMAVLIFGRRLPEVVMELLRALHKLKTSLTNLRSEVNLDSELRDLQRSVHDVVPRDLDSALSATGRLAKGSRPPKGTPPPTVEPRRVGGSPPAADAPSDAGPSDAAPASDETAG